MLDTPSFGNEIGVLDVEFIQGGLKGLSIFKHLGYFHKPDISTNHLTVFKLVSSS
jgi:hypothetical protein